jgi:hypothetical protein
MVQWSSTLPEQLSSHWVAVIIMDKFLIIRPNIMGKTGIRYFILEISGKPSFVEAVL